MSQRLYNYSAGPSMLPESVLKQVQQDIYDYQGRGISIIELSHRDKDHLEILATAKKLYRELMDIPDNYQVVFSHGGGAMQFSSVALNLLGLHPDRRALYCNSGYFTTWALNEAKRFGNAIEACTSEATGFDRIPDFDPSTVNGDAAYLYITTNNTMMGTRWSEFPQANGTPLVGDATSEILSRPIDIQQFGLLFAGFQKNLGPSGMAVAIIREDLLGKALPEIPRQLDYSTLVETDSMPSTPNLFSLYVNRLVLEWTKEQGGTKGMEALNEKKAARLYGVIDASDFYQGHSQPESRSRQNYTFGLPKDLLETFFQSAEQEGLYGLKSPPMRQDVRASMYNAMPYEGADVLASFMEEFERKHG